MTDPLARALLEDPTIETMFLVQEIADSDSSLTLDVYTRNQRNAKQALIDLRAAIDHMLKEWNAPHALLPAASSHYLDVVHTGISWPLRIVRKEMAN